jgi:hypothetical protein
VGYKLRREIRDYAPYDWKPYMRLVAMEIADDANDRTRRSWISLADLCEYTGYSPRMIRHALHKLAAAGFEFRVSHGTGKDGREVFAVRTHAVDYLVPHMPKGGNRMPPLAIPMPVDKSEKGGNGLPPTEPKGGNGLPPNQRKGGNGLPERRQRVAAPPLTPLISGGSVVGGAVEVPSDPRGQEQRRGVDVAAAAREALPRPMSKIELAAWQVIESRRERDAAGRQAGIEPPESPASQLHHETEIRQ